MALLDVTWTGRGCMGWSVGVGVLCVLCVLGVCGCVGV